MIIGIASQNSQWRIACFRVQWRPCIPSDSFCSAVDCGVRSARSRRLRNGMPSNSRPAAQTQIQRQSITDRSSTTISGNSACPRAKPSAAIDSALPRAATNQRAMAVTDRCDIIPCPNSRSAKMTGISTRPLGTMAMARQARARQGITTQASCRTR